MALNNYIVGGNRNPLISGSINSGNIASGQITNFHFRSGMFAPVSGISITINSSGQIQIGIAVPFI